MAEDNIAQLNSELGLDNILNEDAPTPQGTANDSSPAPPATASSSSAIAYQQGSSSPGQATAAQTLAQTQQEQANAAAARIAADATAKMSAQQPSDQQNGAALPAQADSAGRKDAEAKQKMLQRAEEEKARLETLRRQELEATANVVARQKLRELLRQVDPQQELEREAEDLLMELANDFVERVVSFSCKLAKHRGATSLDAKDVLLHLERNWNIRVPGYSSEDPPPHRLPRPSQNHEQRLSAVARDANKSFPARKKPKFEGDE